MKIFYRRFSYDLIIIKLQIPKMFRFIPTMRTGIVQTFGKFSKTVPPGLNFYIPFIQQVFVLSNQLFEMQFDMTVRTSDKVFPILNISLQYRIKP